MEEITLHTYGRKRICQGCEQELYIGDEIILLEEGTVVVHNKPECVIEFYKESGDIYKIKEFRSKQNFI